MATKAKAKTGGNLDSLMKKSQVAEQSLDMAQQMLATAADGLAIKYQDDPYMRGALNGVMPPKEVPQIK